MSMSATHMHTSGRRRLPRLPAAGVQVDDLRSLGRNWG